MKKYLERISEPLNEDKANKVDVKKPVEEHEGEVLQEKRTKSLGHVLHNLDKLFQVFSKGLS